jgi:hypothetical protein
MKTDKLAPYLKPPEWALKDLRIGESRSFSAHALLHADEDGELFAFLHAPPREAGDAKHPENLVKIRRDPDGLVLILRPQNTGRLNLGKMPLVQSSRELFAPIVRLEENDGDVIADR